MKSLKTLTAFMPTTNIGFEFYVAISLDWGSSFQFYFSFSSMSICLCFSLKQFNKAFILKRYCSVNLKDKTGCMYVCVFGLPTKSTLKQNSTRQRLKIVITNRHNEEEEEEREQVESEKYTSLYGKIGQRQFSFFFCTLFQMKNWQTVKQQPSTSASTCSNN